MAGMKARLPPTSATVEDEFIWVDVVRRCGRILEGSWFGYWVSERSRQGDGSDANLMLMLAMDKKAFGRFMWPESLWEQYIADGGDGLSEWV